MLEQERGNDEHYSMLFLLGKGGVMPTPVPEM